MVNISDRGEPIIELIRGLRVSKESHVACPEAPHGVPDHRYKPCFQPRSALGSQHRPARFFSGRLFT